MASRASARRYARALFDVDVEVGRRRCGPRRAAGHRRRDRRPRRAAPGAHQPGVPLGAKQNIARAVLELQPVSKVVARLVTLIVENDDVNEFDLIVEAFEQRVLDFHQVVRAEITSAVPLTDDQVEAIEQSLAASSGVTRRRHAAGRSGDDRRRRRQGRQPRLRRQRRRHLARIRARLVSGESLQ